MALSHPIPAQLAQQVLRHLGGGAGAADSWAESLETACRQLRADLTDTLGSGGANALLVRALYRATRDHPILAGVTVEHPVGGTIDQGRDGCFSGLDQSLEGRDEEEMAAAAAAILTELFGLLVTFLGEDLGLQPVFKFWPGVTLDVKEIDE